MTEKITARAAPHAESQRQAQISMAQMGVDAAFIDRLVETFYGRIQQHETLGPVFERRLAGRWADHMEKMKGFWSAIAFKTGAYGGKPVQAYYGMDGLSEALFAQWLELFSQTLRDIAPNRETHDWFMATAERIARSLMLSLFYNPALDDPARKR